MDDKTKVAATEPVVVPDPHGQAAFLLVESLIHGLIARSALSAEEAIEIVKIAADVKQEVGGAWGDTPATLRRSLHLLDSISASLSYDIPRK